MATLKDLQSMLVDSGSIQLPHSKNHLKYRLPNGKLFITGGTPGGANRGCDNALARLRKELRETHPAIADRGWNKPKRHGTVTIGEIMALRSGPAEPLEQMDFEVVESQPEKEPEIYVYHPPRKPREVVPKPAAPKTLTSEQLAEANRRLKDGGQAAMDAYLNECRDTLVYVTSEVAVMQRRTPVNSFTEDNEMTSVFERAERELKTINARLQTYPAQMKALVTAEEADIERQTVLEEYLKKHRALSEEAASILAFLPEVKPVPISMGKAVGAKKKNTWHKLSFGMADIRDKVFPILRQHGQEFGRDQIMEAIEAANLPGPKPHRDQILAWFYPEAARASSAIRKADIPGRFVFVDDTPQVARHA